MCTSCLGFKKLPEEAEEMASLPEDLHSAHSHMEL